MQPARAAERVYVTSRSRDINGRQTGEVLVNNKVVFRIRSAAGGYSAPERAEVVANRLADMVNSGNLSADDIRVGRMNGEEALLANGDLLITADRYHAEINRTSPLQLASMWRSNLAGSLLGAASSLASNPGRSSGRLGGAAPAPANVGPALSTKIVPILSAGTGIRLGAAQVTGPKRDVEDVKGVAELEVTWKSAARARLYVPVSNLNVLKGIHRVPRVGVSGLADVRLKF
jgi:hypothetical protein